MNDQKVADSIIEGALHPSIVQTYTWVNHYSALINLENLIKLDEFNFVGVDGQFLRLIIGRKFDTTSADRVLPIVFQRNLKVVLIGGKLENTMNRVDAIHKKFPNVEIVGNFDGFSIDFLTFDHIGFLLKYEPHLIVIGSGSPLQEKIALAFANNARLGIKDHGLSIVTCGGWLDQILYESYYPNWSYRLKLNWLVRLFREPGRLWKRYSLFAFLAFLKSRKIRQYLGKIVS